MHNKTLRTSYFAPKNLDYARVRVLSQFVPFWHVSDMLKDIRENHIDAVRAFTTKYGWEGQWCMEKAAKEGYIFIPVISETVIVAGTQRGEASQGAVIF